MESKRYKLTTATKLMAVGFVAAGLLALFAVPATADVRLARIFGSDMVLQRDMPLPIWGWAEPGEPITVRLAGNEAATVARADGSWQVRLPALPAGGPHDMIVSGHNSVKLHGVLIGEVWLCSGQSNMEWGVGMEPNGKQIIAAANHPSIRLFSVAHSYSYTPEPDLKPIPADYKPEDGPKSFLPIQKKGEVYSNVWRPCTPDDIAKGSWNGFSCAAYFFGLALEEKLHVPVGLIKASFGGSDLESFVPPEAMLTGRPGLTPEEHAVRFEAFKKSHPQIEGWYPVVKFNAMIHPLIPMSFRGVIWHQGESNVGRGTGLEYYDGLKALIGGWRAAWGQGEFPFYYVMTGPFRSWKGDDLPRLWDSQLAALSIPNTGYVVTTDIGAPWDLHPYRKDLVGQRLAAWALARTYGVPGTVYSGPLYKSIQVEGGKVCVLFDSIGSGLASRDGRPLTHFEVAGADGQFQAATAVVDHDTIVVESVEVPRPTQVRFAWTWEHTPPPAPVIPPNLINREGLPAAPFDSRIIDSVYAKLPK